MKKILVLCTGNSTRSQMAEGYLNFYATGKALFFSAGLENRGINPLTIRVMEEDNIDISSKRSKDFHIFEHQHFDFLITVCDEAFNQTPLSLHADKTIHISIPDPDKFEGAEIERLEEFRKTREIVKKFVLKFIGQELIEEEILAG